MEFSYKLIFYPTTNLRYKDTSKIIGYKLIILSADIITGVFGITFNFITLFNSNLFLSAFGYEFL